MWHFNRKRWNLSWRMRQTRQNSPIRAEDKRTGSEELSRIQVVHRAVCAVVHGCSRAQPASAENKLPGASEVHFQSELRQQYQSLAVGKGLERWQPMKPGTSATLPAQSKNCSLSGGSLFLSVTKPERACDSDALMLSSDPSSLSFHRPSWWPAGSGSGPWCDLPISFIRVMCIPGKGGHVQSCLSLCTSVCLSLTVYPFLPTPSLCNYTKHPD